jgi:hypothetical protein
MSRTVKRFEMQGDLARHLLSSIYHIFAYYRESPRSTPSTIYRLTLAVSKLLGGQGKSWEHKL